MYARHPNKSFGRENFQENACTVEKKEESLINFYEEERHLSEVHKKEEKSLFALAIID